MPQVWEMSLAHFVGNHRLVDCDAEFEAACADVMEQCEHSWTRRMLMPLDGHPFLYLVKVIRRPDDVLLVCEHPRYGYFTVEGGYVEETLWVEHSLRGRGLSVELVLAKAEAMHGRINPETYTVQGRAAHVAAHRVSVSRALARGMRVPEHALHPCHLT